MKTVIWLEDNPDTIEDDINEIKKELADILDIQIWSGHYKGSSRGVKCIENFKENIQEAIDKGFDIVGFIIDVRIPIADLSAFAPELAYVKSDAGLISGIQIAQYYLRNEEKNSPLEDRFKHTPILFFTVASGVVKQFPWVQDAQKKYWFIEKTTPENFNEVKEWLRQLSKARK
ncbi:MAG: hypothetical protein D0528_10815 [Methylococcales bacterium]|nr:MAG: hypothetical protein D0528_10815 [Methylococcales bacterium]